MSNVLEVAESKWVKDGKDMTTWYVTLDDRTENVPCYDERAKSFVSGAPLPEGFEITKSKAGKDYLKAPGQAGGSRGGGGYAQAWRNSEAGERFNQERMNRRTALMQSVASIAILAHVSSPPNRDILGLANLYYSWLEEDSPVSNQAGADSPSVGPWGEKVPAPPPKVSEGRPATGEGADNLPLGDIPAQLAEVFGSKAKALKAARTFYSDSPPFSIEDITPAQALELIERWADV